MKPIARIGEHTPLSVCLSGGESRFLPEPFCLSGLLASEGTPYDFLPTFFTNFTDIPLRMDTFQTQVQREFDQLRAKITTLRVALAV